MSRFASGGDDEMAQARARHAADEAKWHREDQKVTDKMWRDGERRRQAERSGSRPVGHWRFKELRNTATGAVTGWGAEFEGQLQGMLILRSGDLVCLASGDSERGDPTADEILAAFLHLYPDGNPGLPDGGRRALPSR